MKSVLLAALACASLCACSKPADNTAAAADVQSAPATADASSNRANPPVAPEQNREAAAPAAGQNSFTEDQAKGHLTNGGYTNVSALTQDDQHVWHGHATNSAGKAVAVSVDYQGSVTEQ